MTWKYVRLGDLNTSAAIDRYQKAIGLIDTFEPEVHFVLDEVHFVLDTEVTVPDIAGWRKAHIPSPPKGHKIQVVPDWGCEVFSPSKKSTDREEKCRCMWPTAFDSPGSLVPRHTLSRPMSSPIPNGGHWPSSAMTIRSAPHHSIRSTFTSRIYGADDANSASRISLGDICHW
jgi:hypothetical protein